MAVDVLDYLSFSIQSPRGLLFSLIFQTINTVGYDIIEYETNTDLNWHKLHRKIEVLITGIILGQRGISPLTDRAL